MSLLTLLNPGDYLNVKDFGAIGDGNSHPLSTIISYDGVSTVGWTLPQWQAILPAATSLSNEIDWLAFQTCLNDAILVVPATIHIEVPQGYYLFDSPVMATLPDGLKLSLTGSMEGSTIQVNNTSGGILLTTTSNLTVVLVDRLCFLAGLKNSGTAFGIAGNKNAGQTRRLATITNLFIGSVNDTTDASFDVGLGLTGVSRPYIVNVFVDQGLIATRKMSIGIQFDYCYNPALNNCDVHVRGAGCALGYSHVGDVQQGGRMYGCQAVACDTGGLIAFNDAINEPDFHIFECHFNSYNIGFIIDGLKYAWFHNNEMYCQAVNVTTSADWSSGTTVSVSSTTGVAVGQVITGHANIPIGTTVVRFVANTSITVSNAVTGDVPNGTQLTLGLYQVNVTTSADWPSGTTVSASSTAGVAVGQVITGHANIPIGTTVVSFVANTSITVSNAITGDVASGTQLTLTPPYRVKVPTSADWPSGTTVSASSTTGVAVGQVVTGHANIPTGTTVVSFVVNTSITVSKAVTGDVPSGTQLTLSTQYYVDILVLSCEGLNIIGNKYRQNFQTARYHVRLDVTGSLLGTNASIRGVLIDDRNGYFASTIVPPVYVSSTPGLNTPTSGVTILQSTNIANYDFASYPGWPLYQVVSGSSVNVTTSADWASGSTVSVSSTTGVAVGQVVTGSANIPNATTVSSFVANTSITVSNAVTGDVPSGTSLKLTTTNSPQNVLAKNDLPHVTSLSSTTYTADPFIDEEIIMVNYTGTVTINTPAFGNVTAGKRITIKDTSGAASTHHITVNPGTGTHVTTSADWSSGTTVSVSSTSGVSVGQTVTGSSNIPQGTTVVSFVPNTSITVSNAVTGDVPNGTQLTLGHTIDGATNYVINTNLGAVRLVYSGSGTDWTVI